MRFLSESEGKQQLKFSHAENEHCVYSHKITQAAWHKIESGETVYFCPEIIVIFYEKKYVVATFYHHGNFNVVYTFEMDQKYYVFRIPIDNARLDTHPGKADHPIRVKRLLDELNEWDDDVVTVFTYGELTGIVMPFFEGERLTTLETLEALYSLYFKERRILVDAVSHGNLLKVKGADCGEDEIIYLDVSFSLRLMKENNKDMEASRDSLDFWCRMMDTYDSYFDEGAPENLLVVDFLKTLLLIERLGLYDQLYQFNFEDVFSCVGQSSLENHLISACASLYTQLQNTFDVKPLSNENAVIPEKICQLINSALVKHIATLKADYINKLGDLSFPYEQVSLFFLQNPGVTQIHLDIIQFCMKKQAELLDSMERNEVSRECGNRICASYIFIFNSISAMSLLMAQVVFKYLQENSYCPPDEGTTHAILHDHDRALQARLDASPYRIWLQGRAHCDDSDDVDPLIPMVATASR